MMQRIEQRPDWSRGGIWAGCALIFQVAAGWTAALSGTRITGDALALAAALGIGTVIVLARCLMPAGAKAGLIALGSATLLTCVATQDLLGLRQVERTTAGALDDGATAAARFTTPRFPVWVVTSDPADAQTAQVLGRHLGQRLEAVGADVTVAANLTATDEEYRVSWTLVRGAERLWCGLHTQRPSDGARGLAALYDRVAAAARRSRSVPLDCG